MLWEALGFVTIGLVIGFVVGVQSENLASENAIKTGILHHQEKFYRVEQIDLKLLPRSN